MTRIRAASVLQRYLLRALAAIGVGAAVVLSWWWKVDEARIPDAVPTASFGQAITLGRTVLTPLSLTRDAGTITLTAELLNVTGSTQTAPFGIPAKPPKLTLDGHELPSSDIYLGRDDAPLYMLQPRLPELARFVWTLPEGSPDGPVSIVFLKQLFKLRDNLYGKSSWLAFTPTATMTATPTPAEPAQQVKP